MHPTHVGVGALAKIIKRLEQQFLIIVALMADKLNTGNIEQVYNVREDEAISSGVALVLCVLVQRGVFTVSALQKNC